MENVPVAAPHTDLRTVLNGSEKVVAVKVEVDSQRSRGLAGLSPPPMAD